jgi:hypothetical protein
MWKQTEANPGRQRSQPYHPAITAITAKRTGMSSAEDTPHFIFINPKPSEYEGSLCVAWNRAIAQHFPSDPNAPFTVYEGKLNQLDADLLRCDCIVSPANSYGIMDGGCAAHSWRVELELVLISH